MRRQSTQSIGEAIRSFLDQNHLNRKLLESRSEQIWREAMGAAIAGYTSKVELKGSKLYVTITSSALRQNLMYSRPAIILKLNQHVGGELIKDVILR